MKFWKIKIVRMEGLEPTRLSAPDPKSGSATNYDTSAIQDGKISCLRPH